MEPWTWGVVALLVVGVAVILAGALIDRRRTSRARAEILAPPKRPIPRFAGDLPRPAYVTEVQARRPPPGRATDLSDVDRRAVQDALRDDPPTSVAAGWAARGFVTDEPAGWSVLDHPDVLVCADPVLSLRELLDVLDRATRVGRPLVIAAPSLRDDVVATLEVNRIQGKLDVVAVTTGPTAGPLERIAAATGAVPVARADLQAGHVPDSDLGTCTRWVSRSDRSFVFGEGHGARSA